MVAFFIYEKRRQVSSLERGERLGRFSTKGDNGGGFRRPIFLGQCQDEIQEAQFGIADMLERFSDGFVSDDGLVYLLGTLGLAGDQI